MVLPRIQTRNPESIYYNPSQAFCPENIFMIDDPSSALRWLQQIGKDNVKHLAKLRIFVSGVYNPGLYPSLFGGAPEGPKWCELFDKLASEAIGLRDVSIFWDAEPSYQHLGGGFDVDFVRALARIKGLQKLEIDGWFAKSGRYTWKRRLV